MFTCRLIVTLEGVSSQENSVRCAEHVSSVGKNIPKNKVSANIAVSVMITGDRNRITLLERIEDPELAVGAKIILSELAVGAKIVFLPLTRISPYYKNKYT